MTAAVETSRLLAASALVVITGGGPGIMEAGNRGAREAGGASFGLGIESLTLIQTGKISHFPIVLYGKEDWDGLLEWVRNTMLAERTISSEDLDLIAISDSPEEIRDIVVGAISDGKQLEKREEAARRATRKAYERQRDGG